MGCVFLRSFQPAITPNPSVWFMRGDIWFLVVCQSRCQRPTDCCNKPRKHKICANKGSGNNAWAYRSWQRVKSTKIKLLPVLLGQNMTNTLPVVFARHLQSQPNRLQMCLSCVPCGFFPDLLFCHACPSEGTRQTVLRCGSFYGFCISATYQGEVKHMAGNASHLHCCPASQVLGAPSLIHSYPGSCEVHVDD